MQSVHEDESKIIFGVDLDAALVSKACVWFGRKTLPLPRTHTTVGIDSTSSVLINNYQLQIERKINRKKCSLRAIRLLRWFNQNRKERETWTARWCVDGTDSEKTAKSGIAD